MNAIFGEEKQEHIGLLATGEGKAGTLDTSPEFLSEYPASSCFSSPLYHMEDNLPRVLPHARIKRANKQLRIRHFLPENLRATYILKDRISFGFYRDHTPSATCPATSSSQLTILSAMSYVNSQAERD